MSPPEYRMRALDKGRARPAEWLGIAFVLAGIWVAFYIGARLVISLVF